MIYVFRKVSREQIAKIAENASMITDEQIVKEWEIVKKCENCANRGHTTCMNTGDGPRHQCWCKLTGNPGPLHDLYGLGCLKWKLCSWIRDNYERKHKEDEA